MPPDILMVRLGAIGDILLTTPLVRALRVRYPDARITFVTSARHLPLLEHNPRITRVIGWERSEGLRRLARELRAGSSGGPYTHRLDLQGSWRSRALRRLVGGQWTGYSKQVLARAALIRWKKNWYRDRRPVAERYFDAAPTLGVSPDRGSLEVFLPRSALDRADDFLRRELGSARQLIALAPGAAWATKRWPVHHWVALAGRLLTQGNDVVITGGVPDRALADRIVEETDPAGRAGTVVSAAGLDLPTTAALFKRARALVAGDTGQMHLAVAVGTPVVALFGPTVEAFGFFPYHAKATVLQRDLECRPCSAQGSSACPLRHHRCLQDLLPDEVVAALRRLPR